MVAPQYSAMASISRSPGSFIPRSARISSGLCTILVIALSWWNLSRHLGSPLLLGHLGCSRRLGQKGPRNLYVELSAQHPFAHCHSKNEAKAASSPLLYSEAHSLWSPRLQVAFGMPVSRH